MSEKQIKLSNDAEIKAALELEKKLTTPLQSDGHNGDMASRYLKGGYKQDGYGVPEGAAIDGSHAIDGSQGYYTREGKQKFLDDVANMRERFNTVKNQGMAGRIQIKKPGIGGQHTPFEGVSGMFGALESTEQIQIGGEYELGKNYQSTITEKDVDNFLLQPSSKSGSTDETMMVFVDLLACFFEKAASAKELDGRIFAEVVLNIFHDINFSDGKEISGKDLFKGFSLALVVDNLKQAGVDVSETMVLDVFKDVLGNMVFETTPRAEQSRLAAFIFNSGLSEVLGVKTPVFVSMFDNVGGRWTGDLHMMTFLAAYELDAAAYWQKRYDGILKVREGAHDANTLANMILDNGIKDIALIVPDDAFWFGKSIEQNFNESIWQDGFANLITVKASFWERQKGHYDGKDKLVINLSGLLIDEKKYNVFMKKVPGFLKVSSKETRDALALAYADLFTLFYGMTNAVGDRLIVRALAAEGYFVEDVDLNDLDNDATKIVQDNLFLRQPYVELGKGLLQQRLEDLQKAESMWEMNEGREGENPIKLAENKIKLSAATGELKTNIDEFKDISALNNEGVFNQFIDKVGTYAKETGRKFVPFIYLEGEKFITLREYLIGKGVSWVMQGTGDQHISYQQVLAKPERFLPLIVSVVPKTFISGKPAIGFAKGYLNTVSPNMVRDYFAEASYAALTDLRSGSGGKGFFVRLEDNETMLGAFKAAFTG